MTEERRALLPVTREARSAAIEAERGVIFAARSMADRDCGATQTEMREAREAYMIDAFAKFERAVIERQSHSLPGEDRLSDWRDTIIHPNNRLLFRRMAEVAGIDIGTDDIATALRKVAALTPSALSGDAGEGEPNGVAENKAGGLWYRRWHAAQTRVNELEAMLANPPKHKFWGAGEPDCPREIKAPNGDIHTLRCKVCGLDNPRNDLCRAEPEKEQ